MRVYSDPLGPTHSPAILELCFTLRDFEKWGGRRTDVTVGRPRGSIFWYDHGDH